VRPVRQASSPTRTNEALHISDADQRLTATRTKSQAIVPGGVRPTAREKSSHQADRQTVLPDKTPIWNSTLSVQREKDLIGAFHQVADKALRFIPVSSGTS